MVLQIENTEHFDQIVNDSGAQKHGKSFVVVDFYADWCGPCKRFSPTFTQLAETYGEKVYFLKVNIDDNEELATRYSIRSIPTFMFFDVGSTDSTYDKVVGAQKSKIEERLKYFVGKSLGTNEENFDF